MACMLLLLVWVCACDVFDEAESARKEKDRRRERESEQNWMRMSAREHISRQKMTTTLYSRRVRKEHCRRTALVRPLVFIFFYSYWLCSSTSTRL